MCVQHRLLAEKALTFAKAQEIVQATELADEDVQSLQSTPHVPVHTLNNPLQRTTNRNPGTPIIWHIIHKHFHAVVVGKAQCFEMLFQN